MVTKTYGEKLCIMCGHTYYEHLQEGECMKLTRRVENKRRQAYVCVCKKFVY